MKRPFLALGLAASALGLVVAAGPPGPGGDDLVLAGGRVVDGTASPAFRADVAVRGGRIRFVGRLSPGELRAARRVVDASGLFVAPGFVDLLGQSEYFALVDRRAASKVTQGITTEVTGEGITTAPSNARMIADGGDTWRRYGLRPDWTSFAGFFERFRATPPAINLGSFVGLGAVRELVVGSAERRATAAELSAMAREVERAMREGALGVSTSLQYVPDLYLSTEEIVALAKVAASHGGVYFTHQRSEGNRIDASLDEAFRVAREASIPTNVWHLKTAYRRNWGRMKGVLARFEAARAEGLDVAANQYPWTAASNGLDACLPPWVREGGKEKLLARLSDPTVRERVKAEMAADTSEWENQYHGSGGPPGILVSSVLRPELKRWEGKTIEEVAREQGKDPRDALIDLVVADRAGAYGILSIMGEEDVREALAHRLVAFCTDSPASAEDGVLSEERSHPRGWASTARILATYVRDERLLPLEEAVRKMTSFSASRAGLLDRGLVREGMAADLVAFDLARVKAVSTFADPNRYSEGFRFVAVNGELVVDGGKLTAARPGRPLLGPGARAAAR